MRVVICPDKFAGTLTAVEAAQAIAEGWRSVAPDDELVLRPVADGGPGFVEVLHTCLGGTLIQVPTSDPLGRPVAGSVLVAGDTAYVESAQATGLHHLAADERDPKVTTSFGLGALLTATPGVRKIVIGLGGSATNDAGAGFLAALGLTALDTAGTPLPPGGAALLEATTLTLPPTASAAADTAASPLPPETSAAADAAASPLPPTASAAADAAASPLPPETSAAADAAASPLPPETSAAADAAASALPPETSAAADAAASALPPTASAAADAAASPLPPTAPSGDAAADQVSRFQGNRGYGGSGSRDFPEIATILGAGASSDGGAASGGGGAGGAGGGKAASGEGGAGGGAASGASGASGASAASGAGGAGGASAASGAGGAGGASGASGAGGAGGAGGASGAGGAGGAGGVLGGVELVGASDVDNPLVGEHGASAVYGPQKGASAGDVELLDAALANWAAVLERHLPGCPQGLAGLSGAGAAGGLGAAVLALGGRIISGIDLVLAETGLGDAVAGAGVVITGEGSFDHQSLRGKVIAGVAGAARDQGVPCVVLAGRVTTGRREQGAAGVTEAYSLVDHFGGVDLAMAEPARGLRELSARMARQYSRG